MAEVYSAIHDKTQALQCLTRAYELHDSGLINLKIDPFFSALHSDARSPSCYERSGCRSDAPDIPILKQAKAEYAKL
jgi:hypothetical protein